MIGTCIHRGRPSRCLGALALALILGACQQELPTAQDPNLLPIDVTTVEARLSFSEFAEAARIFGGYGRASELGSAVIANQFGGELDAATLLRFSGYPSVAQVLDTTGTTRPDSSLTFLSGRIVLRLDTLESVHSGPVEFTAHALSEEWDGLTATWESAIDSAGVTVPWSAPGGGALTPIATATWDPAQGDSVDIVVDSAQVAAWADTTDQSRGVRISTTDPGVRMKVNSALFWLETLPSINPDTLIEVLATNRAFTFIYDPRPPVDSTELRVGGAPAWRSILDLAIPSALNGPVDLCAEVSCPVALTPEVISFAALRLTTRTPPASFAPSDTLSLDLRSVLAPDLLPKSPLGPTQVGLVGELLEPELFGSEAGTVIEIPVTGLIRDIVRGETLDGNPVSSSVALLSLFEPLSLQFLSFDGAGAPAEPVLRIILTFSNGIGG
ncbi:MAG: hypothetical protein HKN73_06535 [Gemmatimonadetes bacterium]|nr:hypothetical protein [Gemmatimonadota bacterium]